MVEKIDGLIAAPFTPFQADGTVNVPRISKLTEYLIEQKIKGIFVCGSTGEGPSMTTEERKQVAEAFVQAAKGRLFTFVHVGHNSLADARDLAAHAQAIGADAISATVPTYFKINTQEALIQSLAYIAEEAPDLPFYYYNIPALTGVSLDMVTFLDQARKHLPTLAGIKYTAPYLFEYQACLEAAKGEYDILYGSDEMMLGALATGARGFIGSTYNFMAPVYHHLREAIDQNDLAAAQQHQNVSVQVVRIIVKYGPLAAQKAIMAMIGLDCGSVRLPLQGLTEVQKDAMYLELEALGFFEQISQTV